MEAGERWMLNDVAGKPIYAWDSRDHQFRTTYDQLRRPTETFLREGTGRRALHRAHRLWRRPTQSRGPKPARQGGSAFRSGRSCDHRTSTISKEICFKQRQLAREYKATLDWLVAVPLEPEVYTSSTRFDALNRPVEQIAPDSSVYRPTFNEANLLGKVDVHLRGAAAATPFVTDIDYNAKGQRTLIEYGNGVRTTYEYDPADLPPKPSADHRWLTAQHALYKDLSLHLRPGRQHHPNR